MSFPALATFSGISVRLPSALPWAGLPDSLDTLASMATRLQAVITLALNHPIWAVVAVVFTIGLLQILADLVKRLIKSSVAFVLKMPLALSQWLWKQATYNSEASEARIDQLIDRLDELRVEQEQVIAELKFLLTQSTAIQKNSMGSAPAKRLMGSALSGRAKLLQDASEKESAAESASS